MKEVLTCIYKQLLSIYAIKSDNFKNEITCEWYADILLFI